MLARHTRLRRGLNVARLGFWLAVAAAGWYLFAPVQLGGFDSYVLTDGTSMLPTIHGGGLVITREASSYKVGEVAAYHSAVLGGAVILHRIVAIHDGHYTFKGDNNAQPDMYPPRRRAIVGKKWIYWGSGGTLIDNLKTPWVGGPLLGLLGMWAFADIGRRKKKPGDGDGDGEPGSDSDESNGTIVLRPVETL
jgi:signal peptidase I